MEQPPGGENPLFIRQAQRSPGYKLSKSVPKSQGPPATSEAGLHDTYQDQGGQEGGHDGLGMDNARLVQVVHAILREEDMCANEMRLRLLIHSLCSNGYNVRE